MANEQYIVEKIGGTSMSQFDMVIENVINRPSRPDARRVIVVSAYGGVTDLLLTHKKTKVPGIYGCFSQGGPVQLEFERLRERLLAINYAFAALGLDIEQANQFVEQRLASAERFLDRVSEVLAYGYVDRQTLLLAVRELIASIGESHSAFNTVNILRSRGIACELVDLSGWHDKAELSIDERIQRSLAKVDLASSIAIVTGYCKGTEGIMRVFDRGYSEITFSRTALLLNAVEAVIHKEYHLSSGDPVIIGEDRVKPIGKTNFDVADQLADIEMEAIHPKASKPLEKQGIPIRVRNVFDPDHSGTLITQHYCSREPRVEIVSGCDRVVAIEVHDTAMVGEVGFDYRVMQAFAELSVSYTYKSTNANTITVGVLEKEWSLTLHEHLKRMFVSVESMLVAAVCAIGSNLREPGFLAIAASALAEANINILSVAQATRQTNIQFIIERKDFLNAQKVLHRALCES